MNGWRAAVAVLGAVTVLAGCGFVTDDPAGVAASGPSTTVRRPLTTVAGARSTLPDGTPADGPQPGGDPGAAAGATGSAGGDAATAPGGAGTPGGTGTPGGATGGAGGSAGGGAPSSGAGGGRGATTTTSLVPGGPGWDALPEPEKVLVRTCTQMVAFQRAGGTAVVDSIERPEAAYGSLASMVDSLDGLAAVAPADLAPPVRSIAGALRGGLSGDRSPPVLFGRMNTVIANQELAINTMLRAVNRLCPAQVAADTVDQGSFFRLGTPLPPELIGSLTPR
ncbi:MAG: hypothetical protein ACOYOP_15055 [Microthrixaceae bacterium]